MNKNKKDNFRVVFMGTPDFAVPVLQKLIAGNWNVASVVTQPDQKAGRKQKLTPSAIKTFAKKQNLPVLEIASLKDKASQQQVLQLKPDLIIVCAFGLIMPKEILEHPRFHCLNIHASLLPKYRGASPIQTALLNGDKETGITIMKMAEGLDTGDIISQKNINISVNDNYIALSDKLAVLGAELIVEILPIWITGEIITTPQNEKQATFTKILTRADGLINWQEKADAINNKIRAYFPWPGTFTFLETKSGKKRLKIISAELLLGSPDTKRQAGLLQTRQNQLIVETGSGQLILKQLQLEG